MNIRKNYNHTLNACYLGYITQAIVNNFAPLLFLTFQSTYEISLDKIALLVSFNFGVQLIVDLLAGKICGQDRIPQQCGGSTYFRSSWPGGTGSVSVRFSGCVCRTASGSILLCNWRWIDRGADQSDCRILSDRAKGCCDESSAFFLLLGACSVILISTAFFAIAGIENWRILAVIWAILPALNAVYFGMVPIQAEEEDVEGIPVRELFKMKIFWVLVLLMICAGASEQGMSQWASAFAESGLHVEKAVGDLAGPCLFALLMGSSRLLYAKMSERISLPKMMLSSGILCIVSYLLAALSPNSVLALLGCGLCGFSVGVFWPGTFSMAAASCPKGGTALFALLALAGDLGCSSGPGVVGVVSGAFSENLKAGLLAAIVFPVLLIIGLQLLKEGSRERGEVR